MAKLCFPSVPNTLGVQWVSYGRKMSTHVLRGRSSLIVMVFFSLICQGKERHFFIHILSSFIADYIKGFKSSFAQQNWSEHWVGAGLWGTKTKHDGHSSSGAHRAVEVSALAVVIGRECVKGREKEGDLRCRCVRICALGTLVIFVQ